MSLNLNLNKDYPLILKAIRFAEEKHKGQKRRISNEDYVSHPIAVSYLASNFKKSKNLISLICAAILLRGKAQDSSSLGMKAHN
jgi:(p)ppGpp synthase/HD superfamily hydrolase